MAKPVGLFAISAGVVFLNFLSGGAGYQFSSSAVASSSIFSSKCGRHERWVRCPEAVCVPKSCDDIGFPIGCYDLRPGHKCPGRPRCICQEGYVRNANGHCIPARYCPSCGGDCNAQSGCGNCNRLCSNYHQKNVSCTDVCYFNACDCKKGYVLDESNNKCVKPYHCTRSHAPKCKKNEVFDLCPAPCPYRTCGINDAAVDCVPAFSLGDPNCAPPKCRCKDGYYKNDVGECVKLENCPQCLKPNEIYDPCIAPCPPRRCDVDEATILCLPSPVIGDDSCVAGCRCADGYYKNSQGVCVTRDQCTMKCKEGEKHELCPQSLCQPLLCTDVGFNITCPTEQCDYPRKPACICAKNYVRDCDGKCIPKSECPSCGGDPNAKAGCGVYCNKRCRDIGQEPAVCTEICYENACDCLDGYFLDENTGKCVLPEQCTPQCGVDEVYSECVNGGCQAKNCSQIGLPLFCPKIKNSRCKKGCLCKKGYLRNEKGICIPEERCPQKCPKPNEIYDPCIAPCPPRRCDVDDRVIRCAEQPEFGDPLCVAGCRCADGFYRNAKGICVTRDECPLPCKSDERYEKCPPFLCQPSYCTEVGFPVTCPTQEYGCLENAACICDNNYVRDSEGKCIPRNQCPSCGGDPNARAGCGVNCNKRCQDIGNGNNDCLAICYDNACDCLPGYYLDENTGKCVLPEQCTPTCLAENNEVYSDCTNGGCTRRNCSQYGKPVPCPKLRPEACIKGCICKEGYLRSSSGKCVPENDCPEACIKPHEKYNNCTYNCPPQTCDSLDRVYACPIKTGDNCQGICKCKKGYYRNKIGECITEEQCRQCSGPHEYYSCGGACDNVCATIKEQNQTNCPIVNIKCNEMCYCEKDYARALNGTCIPITSCNEPQCPANEKYEKCPGAACQPLTCSQVGNPIECPAENAPCPTKPGCVCLDGYVRDDNGKCIPKNQCPSCGGDPNAKAGCGVYCNKRCRDIGQEPAVCTEICYENACDCLDGYFLDENTGKCVLPEQCTPQCGVDEVYSECVNGGCQAKNCSQIGLPLFCPKIKNSRCKKGCLCKKGYLRNEKGICIPEERCPQKCPKPNEIYDPCIAPCPPRRCDVDDRVIRCAEQPEFGDPLCVAGCRCADGFYRNAKGICVTRDECPLPCNSDERYEKCPPFLCQPSYCTEVGFPVTCPTQEYGCPGNAACICDNNYVRNSEGKCIPRNQCPSCGGDPNARAGCGVNCNKRCQDIGNENNFCLAICYDNACDCLPGYYLDENTGKCVHPEQCTPTCRENEEYNDCVNSNCDPQNCTQVGFPIACPRIVPKYCKKGCQCKSGYARNSQGICIPLKQCPACRGDSNAQSGCGGYCNKKCSDIGNPRRPCPRICEVNACDCKDGYYLDTNTKQCVKPEECTPTCLAENNEVYSDCTNGGCTRRNCSQYGKPVPCPKLRPEACIKGCICKEGYLRSSSGKCVPENDCPEACIKPHEKYNICSYNCPPQTCDSLDRVYACPIKTGDNCQGICKCEKGYYRNKIGECITEEQCRQCSGPHEYYSCGGACDNVCATIKEQNQTSCPIVNIKCNEMCYCEKDYARALNGTCIPITSCNEPQCPANEKYEQCPVAACQPLTCSQVGNPIVCPAENAPCPTKPACVCLDGYVRDDNGKCIPKNQCPSCGGDENAVSGCGVNCGKNCENLITGEDVACILVCFNNACNCKGGYYYDSKQKKCVLPRECTDICGKNEMFEDCTEPACRAKNCNDLGFPLDCNANCTKGCICKENYVRNEKGICIPAQECPSCGGDSNAISACGVNCGKLCPNNDRNPNVCPRICYPNACDCRDGFYFDNITKKCVKLNECTPKCGANEEINDCVNANCAPQNCTQLGFPIPCPRINPMYCVKGCQCKSGYARNEKGVCIPVTECPSCGGDVNAVSGCGVNCNQRCSDLRESGACADIENICSINGCDCKKGYYLDSETNTCIKPENCNVCNRQHEIFKNCTYDCPPQTCESFGKVYKCPLQTENNCKPSCRCESGYYRNKLGECITEAQCRKCSGPHEYYSCGGACDNVCATIKKQNQTSCPIVNIKCNEMCYCEKDYARALNGTCIPITSCNEPQCPANEKYVKNPKPSCEPRLCSEIGKTLSDRLDKPGCICVHGYLRNSEGKCVPQDKCPPICDEYKNEVYDSCVNGGCGKRNCSELSKPVICKNILNCEKGCKCKEGYLRANNGTCVPINKCPAPQCKENEVFEQCPPRACRPQTCSAVGYPVDCPTIKDDQCGYPACICSVGYARNDKGVCIPNNQCPTCGGDPNATPGCGFHCPNRCPKAVNAIFCARIQCQPVSCDCKQGYLYDPNTKKCVKPEECSPTCDQYENEVYDSCVNGGCDKRNCSELSKPNICKNILNCEQGCKCKEGYLRANNGTCVPINKCPAPKCKANEEYEKCPPRVNRPLTCSAVGYPVKQSNITDDKCGYPECICCNGYARNNKGICVPTDQCPACGGDKNAKPGCGYNCGKRCPKATSTKFCPRIQCQPTSCDCKDNFLYDSNTKKCVKPEQCTPVCDESNNEVFDICVNGGCDWKNCSQVGGPQYCVDVDKCIPGCSCKKGYLRYDDGSCVPIYKCPKRQRTSTTTTTTTTTTEKPIITPTRVINTTTSIANFGRGNQALTGKCLYQLLQERPGQSFMISTFSILLALAQVLIAATGVSLQQLLKLCNVSSKAEIEAIFPIILSGFKEQNGVTFEVAVKIFGNINIPFNDKYIETSEKVLGAAVQNVDFSQSAAAANIINEWVSDSTHGLITELVNDNAFNANTVTFLANCLYFLGNWTKPFKPANTKPRDFFISDTKTLSLPTMTQKGRFKYAENQALDAKILEMPYIGNDFTFIIILPNNKNGLTKLVNKLQDQKIFYNIIKSLSYQEVEVFMPKFDLSTTLDLSSLLKKNNVTAPFQAGTSDLKGMVKGDKSVSITDAIQKTRIKVFEAGTEAAATTGITISLTSAVLMPTEVYIFDVDHPCPFYIMYRDYNVVFAGIFAGN